MSSQTTLKDYWTNSRKATAASKKLTGGAKSRSSDVATTTTKVRTAFGPRGQDQKQKRTLSTSEDASPSKKRRTQRKDNNYKLPCESFNSFRFLGLPYDIQHIMYSRYINADDLISLSQTCRALRLECLDSYLRVQGVISQTFSNATAIDFHRQAPRLVFIILTSELLNYYSWTKVAVVIHLPHLVFYQNLLYEFIRSITGKIIYFTLLFHHRDHSFLNNSSLPSSLISILSIVGENCITVDISEDTMSLWTIEESHESHSEDSLRFEHSGDVVAVPPTLQEIGMGRLMSGILLLNLDLYFFCTPMLGHLLSILVKGESVCELSAVCPTQKDYRFLIATLCCPALEKLQVVVHDAFPIFLSDHLIRNHTRLERLSILNVIGNNEVIGTPSNSSILHLPPLQEVSISANYSLWTTTDSNHIRSFTVQPLNTVVRPPNSRRFCNSVRSLIKPTICYRDPLPARFLLELSFPAVLTRHISVPTLSEWKTIDCICFPCNTDQTVTNIQILRLRFDTINRHIFRYLMKWLAWFPELRELEIDHNDDEDVRFSFTSQELIGLRSQCCTMLMHFQCAAIWKEPEVWKYHCNGDGWKQIS